jgi:hypothetical protein
VGGGGGGVWFWRDQFGAARLVLGRVGRQVTREAGWFSSPCLEGNWGYLFR